MSKFDRREALVRCAALMGTLALPRGGRAADTESEAPYNALGERVGEVGADSAVVHTRLTAAPTRNNRGYGSSVTWMRARLSRCSAETVFTRGAREATSTVSVSAPISSGNVRRTFWRPVRCPSEPLP
jgi:phosphodiesterase/alkaline phosphatase D-like protein